MPLSRVVMLSNDTFLQKCETATLMKVITLSTIFTLPAHCTSFILRTDVQRYILVTVHALVPQKPRTK